MRSILRITVGAAVLAMATGCGSPQREAVETGGPPVPVKVETVRMAQVPVTVTAVGTTEPYARATPATRLMGRVLEVKVSEGERVSKGAVLVRIEDRDLTARRRQAESGLASAKAVLKNAETTVRRIRNLFREHAIPKQNLDDAETAYTRAQEAVSAAEGGVREVEANLRYSAIASPLDGVVVRKFVQVGDMAAPGAPLFTVEQQNPMKVVVDLSEGDLTYARVDSPVMVEVGTVGEGGSGVERQGRVETVVPSADPASRTFQVKVVVPNSDLSIHSGMFARVRFPRGNRPGILVPTAALIRQGQLQGVYVVSGGRTHLRWVRLGKPFGKMTEVISGLQPGDKVAVSGLDSVTDGGRVEVKGDA